MINISSTKLTLVVTKNIYIQFNAYEMVKRKVDMVRTKEVYKNRKVYIFKEKGHGHNNIAHENRNLCYVYVDIT